MGKGGNVTSAGWQVTLCDPIWHVGSSSGVATSVSELLYPCYFTFTYFTLVTFGLFGLQYGPACSTLAAEWRRELNETQHELGVEAVDVQDAHLFHYCRLARLTGTYTVTHTRADDTRCTKTAPPEHCIFWLPAYLNA